MAKYILTDNFPDVRVCFRSLFLGLLVLLTGPAAPVDNRPNILLAPSRRQLSGIYPHLAMFNDEDECGTGAVAIWADRLWVVTYAPHAPGGSTDKLYEITSDLRQIIRPESLGGTPANRMIHRESQQLFIGPYAIDANRNVRAIPYEKMFGRPTGNARHLTNPANKIYCATMEEGFYEVDVNRLTLAELWSDTQKTNGHFADLPGTHGKGLYSGQGRLIYANNGDPSPEARRRPESMSGALVEWDGQSDAWRLVRRNQFTEVAGPGGLYGNSHPEKDPVWSIGWDKRSLILMLLDAGQWHAYRLPKTSHCYDGAHGWHTEWPRIRDIGERDWLMTMHGMFWRFPKTFSAANSMGIAPRSTYLKVIGDFCRWNDHVVFGCDDTAQNQFSNQRKAKGNIAPPQSQSNLWFVKPGGLDDFGPALGRGAVWLEDDVAAGMPSEPFLFCGFDRRGLHLTHDASEPVSISLEADVKGNGRWTPLRTVKLDAHGYLWLDLSSEKSAAWVRLKSQRPLAKATAWFHFANEDKRPCTPDTRFSGLAAANDTSFTGGIIRALSHNQRTLHFAATEARPDGPRDLGLYELDADLNLRYVKNPAALAFEKKNAVIPAGVLTVDDASVIFTDDSGKRWRLPKGDTAFDYEGPLGPSRVDREIVTERDLFNAHGTFYELPAENSGGFAKIRPISTHNRRVVDYCSYRGLIILSGVSHKAPGNNPHIIRSEDGRAALWAGVVDDLWKLGKPRGVGGPWKNSRVEANEPSDPYLMTGYDRKTLTLSHAGTNTINVRLEIDLSGTGLWRTYRTVAVPAGRVVTHKFPAAFQAYWMRVQTDQPTVATAALNYD